MKPSEVLWRAKEIWEAGKATVFTEAIAKVSAVEREVRQAAFTFDSCAFWSDVKQTTKERIDRAIALAEAEEE
ncbi:MAG: hypothetical protein V3W37_08165 [Candidatus Binatia bacterium]